MPNACGSARVRRAGPFAALCCAIAIAALAAPAHGALRWSKPERVSPGSTSNPRVAIDALGTVLVAWGQPQTQPAGLTYRWRSPLGRWTDAQTLPGIGNHGPTRIAMTPLGDALVAYSDMSTDVSYTTAPRGGDFSPPKLLGEPGERGFVTLATDDAGNAVAGWVRSSDGAIRIATKRPGLDFGPAQTIDVPPSGTTGSGWLSVAVNAAGAGVVAWSNHRQNADGSRTTSYRISYRPPAGAFGPPEDAPLTIRDGANQHVGLSQIGEVVLAVQQRILDGAGGLTYAVRGLLGGWSAPRELGPLAEVRNVFTEPTGGVSFLMQKESGQRPSAPSDNRVQFATHQANGTLAGPDQISEADGHDPAGAMNLRGDLLAAWGVGAGADNGSAFVAVAERPVGGAFGAQTIISDRDVYAIDVALNDASQAAALWRRTAAPGDQFRYAAFAAFRFDPDLAAVPPPPGVDIGRPIDPILDDDGIVVPVECDQACTVQPSGLLVEGTSVAARAKKGTKLRLKKGARGRVRVRFGAAGREAAREALGAGRKPWVSVTVRAKGRSPRAKFVSRRAKLQ